MIPAIIFLVVLALVGLVGNSLVLAVYSRRFSRTSTRIFIMSIAGFDLVSNVIVTPGEIYDMFHYWDFEEATFCGFRMFFSAFTTISAAMILLGVAVVRYRKVCRPFGWQVTIPQAKIICISIALASLLFAVPNGVVFGRQTKETPRPDIVGHECTTDDTYVDTILPLLITGFFLLLFLLSFIPLVVLYSLIGVQAWRHRKVYGAAKSPATGQATKSMESSGESKSSDSGAMTKSTNDSSSSSCQIRLKNLGCSVNESYTDDENINETAHEKKANDHHDNFDTIDLDEVGSAVPKKAVPLEGGDECNTEEPRDAQQVSFAAETREGQTAPENESGFTESKNSSSSEISDKPTEIVSATKTNSHPSQKERSGKDKIINTGNEQADNQASLKKLNPSRGSTSSGLRGASIVRKFHSKMSIVGRSIRSKSTTTEQSKNRRGIGRTTTMLLVITVVYITSLLPHLGCMFYKFTSPESYAAMTLGQLMVYNVFLRFYFINSAANPVIYSLCDINFRKQCRAMFTACQRS